MRGVFVLLWFTLIFGSSLQNKDNGRTTYGKVDPKTFKGEFENTEKNTTKPQNRSRTLSISNEPALEYMTGLLSTKIIPAAYMVAISIGIPSNTFVLIRLCKKTKVMPTDILFFSLAITDLLLLLSLTLRVHYHLNGNHWIFNEFACKLVTSFFYGNIYCSVYAHMCISVARYLAVVHPFVYRGLSKLCCISLGSLAVWVVCAAAMVPEFLVHHSYQIVQLNITTCNDVLPYKYESNNFLIPYRLGLIGLGFVLPSAVIAFAYGSIILQLSRSNYDWAHYVKASTLVFAIFLVCLAPSNVIHCMHYIKLYSGQEDTLYIHYSAAVCLCCFHSCLDPFLSFLISKTSTPRHFQTFKNRPVGVSGII